MKLEDFTFVPFEDSDLDEVFLTPVFDWYERVPVGSYVRYYDKYLFKTAEDKLIAAYVDDLSNYFEV